MVPGQGFPLYFLQDDLFDVMKDPLMIKADISSKSTVKKVIIDNESSVDVLYYDAFLQMGYKREL